MDTIGNVAKKRAAHTDMRNSSVMKKSILEEDVGISLERTLDEAYYPSLDRQSREARNMDQVISGEHKRTSGRDTDDLPLLMVSQLWL